MQRVKPHLTRKRMGDVKGHQEGSCPKMSPIYLFSRNAAKMSPIPFHQAFATLKVYSLEFYINGEKKYSPIAKELANSNGLLVLRETGYSGEGQVTVEAGGDTLFRKGKHTENKNSHDASSQSAHKCL